MKKQNSKQNSKHNNCSKSDDEIVNDEENEGINLSPQNNIFSQNCGSQSQECGIGLSQLQPLSLQPSLIVQNQQLGFQNLFTPVAYGPGYNGLDILKSHRSNLNNQYMTKNSNAVQISRKDIFNQQSFKSFQNYQTQMALGMINQTVSASILLNGDKSEREQTQFATGGIVDLNNDVDEVQHLQKILEKSSNMMSESNSNLFQKEWKNQIEVDSHRIKSEDNSLPRTKKNKNQIVQHTPSPVKNEECGLKENKDKNSGAFYGLQNFGGQPINIGQLFNNSSIYQNKIGAITSRSPNGRIGPKKSLPNIGFGGRLGKSHEGLRTGLISSKINDQNKINCSAYQNTNLQQIYSARFSRKNTGVTPKQIYSNINQHVYLSRSGENIAKQGSRTQRIIEEAQRSVQGLQVHNTAQSGKLNSRDRFQQSPSHFQNQNQQTKILINLSNILSNVLDKLCNYKKYSNKKIKKYKKKTLNLNPVVQQKCKTNRSYGKRRKLNRISSFGVIEESQTNASFSPAKKKNSYKLSDNQSSSYSSLKQNEYQDNYNQKNYEKFDVQQQQKSSSNMHISHKNNFEILGKPIVTANPKDRYKYNVQNFNENPQIIGNNQNGRIFVESLTHENNSRAENIFKNLKGSNDQQITTPHEQKQIIYDNTNNQIKQNLIEEPKFKIILIDQENKNPNNQVKVTQDVSQHIVEAQRNITPFLTIFQDNSIDYQSQKKIQKQFNNFFEENLCRAQKNQNECIDFQFQNYREKPQQKTDDVFLAVHSHSKASSSKNVNDFYQNLNRISPVKCDNQNLFINNSSGHFIGIENDNISLDEINIPNNENNKNQIQEDKNIICIEKKNNKKRKSYTGDECDLLMNQKVLQQKSLKKSSSQFEQQPKPKKQADNQEEEEDRQLRLLTHTFQNLLDQKIKQSESRKNYKDDKSSFKDSKFQENSKIKIPILDLNKINFIDNQQNFNVQIQNQNKNKNTVLLTQNQNKGKKQINKLLKQQQIYKSSQYLCSNNKNNISPFSKKNLRLSQCFQKQNKKISGSLSNFVSLGIDCENEKFKQQKQSSHKQKNKLQTYEDLSDLQQHLNVFASQKSQSVGQLMQNQMDNQDGQNINQKLVYRNSARVKDDQQYYTKSPNFKKINVQQDNQKLKVQQKSEKNRNSVQKFTSAKPNSNVLIQSLNVGIPKLKRKNLSLKIEKQTSDAQAKSAQLKCISQIQQRIQKEQTQQELNMLSFSGNNMCSQILSLQDKVSENKKKQAPKQKSGQGSILQAQNELLNVKPSTSQSRHMSPDKNKQIQSNLFSNDAFQSGKTISKKSKEDVLTPKSLSRAQKIKKIKEILAIQEELAKMQPKIQTNQNSGIQNNQQQPLRQTLQLNQLKFLKIVDEVSQKQFVQKTQRLQLKHQRLFGNTNTEIFQQVAQENRMIENQASANNIKVKTIATSRENMKTINQNEHQGLIEPKIKRSSISKTNTIQQKKDKIQQIQSNFVSASPAVQVNHQQDTAQSKSSGRKLVRLQRDCSAKVNQQTQNQNLQKKRSMALLDLSSELVALNKQILQKHFTKNQLVGSLSCKNKNMIKNNFETIVQQQNFNYKPLNAKESQNQFNIEKVLNNANTTIADQNKNDSDAFMTKIGCNLTFRRRQNRLLGKEPPNQGNLVSTIDTGNLFIYNNEYKMFSNINNSNSKNQNIENENKVQITKIDEIMPTFGLYSERQVGGIIQTKQNMKIRKKFVNESNQTKIQQKVDNRENFNDMKISIIQTQQNVGDYSAATTKIQHNNFYQNFDSAAVTSNILSEECISSTEGKNYNTAQNKHVIKYRMKQSTEQMQKILDKKLQQPIVKIKRQQITLCKSARNINNKE